MGSIIKLTAEDGHQFNAWRAEPAGEPKGGVVVLQEVFGVNDHIREVTDGFAADGYVAVAPAIYDRVSPDVALPYTPEAMTEARSLRDQAGWDGPVMDIRAAVKSLPTPVGVVGYCWGGSLTFLTACRVEGVSCGVSYYGGQIVPFKDEKPACPLMMHFGDMDASIPMEDIETIRAAQPQAEIHVYHADHGFNCDHRGQFEPDSAKLARERTLAFFSTHMKG